MPNLSNLIIAEGDTGWAVFWCAVCNQNFRARMDAVVTANKQPICVTCIKEYNPKRAALGLPPIAYSEDAYDL